MIGDLVLMFREKCSDFLTIANNEEKLPAAE